MVRKPSIVYRDVVVLRVGHRRERDKRITTHVALVARAYGASGFILAGECDEQVITSIEKVVERWGDEFYVNCTENGVRYAREWRRRGGEVIHLTMYGLPLLEVYPVVATSAKPKLVIVGAEKVPRQYYEIADYNISVGLQPHSEVAALASFLSTLFRDAWPYTFFTHRKIAIFPSFRDKKIVELHG